MPTDCRPPARLGARSRLPLVPALAILALTVSTSVRGQGATIGTFRWQVLPFCNVLSLTVVQQGGSITSTAATTCATGRAWPASTAAPAES